jgi:hypothetical protein
MPNEEKLILNERRKYLRMQQKGLRPLRSSLTNRRGLSGNVDVDGINNQMHPVPEQTNLPVECMPVAENSEIHPSTRNGSQMALCTSISALFITRFKRQYNFGNYG